MFDWLIHLGASRFLSLVIAAGYLGIVLFMPGHRSIPGRLGAVLAVAAYLLIPLLCIWFGEEMGNYIGTLPGPAINKQTPGCLVRIGGWILLLFPVVVLLIGATQ
jgi:hypothetical protein